MSPQLVEMDGVVALANTIGFFWGMAVARWYGRRGQRNGAPPFRNPPPSFPHHSQALVRCPTLTICICGECENCQTTLDLLEKR